MTNFYVKRIMGFFSHLLHQTWVTFLLGSHILSWSSTVAVAILWVTLSVVTRIELTPFLCCPLYDEGVFLPFPLRLMKWLSSTRGVRGSNTEMRWPQLSVPSPPSYFFFLPALCSVTGTPRRPPDKAHAVSSLWRISFTIFPGNSPKAAKIKNKREVLSQCLSIPPPRLCPRHSAAVSTETFTSFTAL